MNSNPAGAGIGENDTPNETNGVNTQQCCQLLQKGSTLQCFLFTSQNLWNGNGLSAFFVMVTLIKIVNTPLDRWAALVLCIINWTYCSCTGICQIQLEIWPEPDSTGFWICRSQSRNPVQPCFKPSYHLCTQLPVISTSSELMNEMTFTSFMKRKIWRLM